MMTEDNFIDVMNTDFPNLKITKHDLANPTRPFVMQYYSVMLETVLRMPVKDICNFTREQQEFLAGPGMNLTGHITSYNLYMGVKYLLDQIEHFPSEFHFSDILFPYLTPKRSFVFMTTLYNFYASCAEFDEVYEQLDTVESKKAAMTELDQEQAQLKQQILKNEENKVYYKERAKEIKKQLAELSVRHEEEQMTIKEFRAEEQIHLEKLNLVQEQECKTQDEFSKLDNERKYHESLIVADDSQVIENHRKLIKKKEECFQKLQALEQQVHDGSTKVSQFDTMLSLYNALNENLRGEISVENKTLDLKGLHNSASALKKEIQALKKEEGELLMQVREKGEAIPCLQNELSQLEKEKDSITCTWKEKEGKYRSLIRDLQRILSEMSHRAEMEQAGLRDTVRKISELEVIISSKEQEIRQIDSVYKEKLDKMEEAIIRALKQIVAQTEAFKAANLK